MNLGWVQTSNSPILVAVILGVSWNSAELLSVTTQHLWVERELPATAVTKRLHHRINLLLKHLRQLQKLQIKYSKMEQSYTKSLTFVQYR